MASTGVGKNYFSPYIIGLPIDKPENLFGRENLFHLIKDILNQRGQVILLHGQRRIGKSSVLRLMTTFLGQDEFVFVPFDFQHQSQSHSKDILHELATEIVEHLGLTNRVELPSVYEIQSDPYILSHKFFPKVYEVLGSKKIVLLLDEFDVLDGNTNILEQDLNFFRYLEKLLQQQKELFIVAVVGRYPEHLPNLVKLFKNAPTQEIGFLDELSAKRLITKPAEGTLIYEQEAIQEILKLSAGHPFFTQVICFTLFGQARKKNNWTVTGADVKNVVEEAIKNAESGLVWFWDGVPPEEQAVLSAAAEAQRQAESEDRWVPEDPLKLLKSLGVQTEPLVKAAEQLFIKGFLDDTRSRVTIGLVRHWLVQRYPLKQVIGKVAEGGFIVLENNANKSASENAFGSVSVLKGTPPIEVTSPKSLTWICRGYKDAPHLPVTLERNQQCSECRQTFDSSNYTLRRKRVLWSGIAAVVGLMTFVGVGARWSTPCPTGEQKVLGIKCVVDPNINISRGERTLFPNIENSARDQGIDAFKKGNYSQAVDFFRKAVVADRNDPEVLIYYNNALARQQGSPVTLAVVVPVDNQAPTAQEKLRGVAQSQNQFNNKQQKLKSRLLEIAIANDSDSPDKAKQVAQQLIKDRSSSSVLGVIGHYSSAATKAALAEYEKAGLAIISPTSTSTLLTSHVFFRTVPSDATTGKKLAEYARNLRLNTVVIFSNPGDPYSDSLSKEFTQNFQQLGGKVVGKPINLTEKLNVETEVKNSLLAYQAQAALLFPNIQHTDVALQVAKANATFMADPQNLKKRELKLLGGDTLYSNTTLKEDNVVEGLIVAVPWFREASQAQDFSNAAAKQWKGQVSWVTATSYDATQAFIKALSPNPSRSTVLQRLPQVKLSSSETSGEALQFTSDGERQSTSILVQVKRGEFVEVKEGK